MLIANQTFADAILRVRKLDALYTHLTTALHFPKNEVSDILRGEIVYTVSALDKYIHDVVRHGMVETFRGIRTATPAYKSFSITLDQFESIKLASSIPPPEAVFERTVTENHRHLSFQDPDKIASALSLIWVENHKWQKISACMGISENDARVELKNIVIRRNQIVHEGDVDLSTGLLYPIEQIDVQESVNFIENLVNCIQSLI